MKPVDIHLPTGAKAANYLFPQMGVEDLTQDVMTVVLPTGYCVDVGWYPEHDPSGRYLIRVFEGRWDRQVLPKPIATRETLEVVRAVEDLADRFSKLTFNRSSSGETLLPAAIII